MSTTRDEKSFADDNIVTVPVVAEGEPIPFGVVVSTSVTSPL